MIIIIIIIIPKWFHRFRQYIQLASNMQTVATSAQGLRIQHVHRDATARSWGPLSCHSSTTITSCCSAIMQGSVHSSWKLKTSQFLHDQNTWARLGCSGSTCTAACSSSSHYPATLHSHWRGEDQHSTGHNQQPDQDPPNKAQLHMLAWPFAAACLRRTCAIAMRSNQCSAPTQQGLCCGVLLSLSLSLSCLLCFFQGLQRRGESVGCTAPGPGVGCTPEIVPIYSPLARARSCSFSDTHIIAVGGGATALAACSLHTRPCTPTFRHHVVDLVITVRGCK